jgi:hypothetical protein
MKSWVMGLLLLPVLGFGPVSPAADFDGDGTGDIAVFRAGSGLWSVRDVTRLYLGSAGDVPVPGDYDGNGTDRAAVFRAAGSLWSVRDLTRIYFGGGTDEAMPGDYTGDGTDDVAAFRRSAGLWAARNVTRVYFGGAADVAISPANFIASGVGGLLKTGQFTEYSSGDDGTYQKGINFSYQTSDPAGNGEIVTTDNVTRLIWASDGDGAGSFNGQTAAWERAVDWAESLEFAGYSDWRLPNRVELESLLNSGTHSPAIAAAFFPNTKSTYYWTSTSYSGNHDIAFFVDFNYGATGIHGKPPNKHYVRAVRGG